MDFCRALSSMFRSSKHTVLQKQIIVKHFTALKLKTQRCSICHQINDIKNADSLERRMVHAVNLRLVLP